MTLDDNINNILYSERTALVKTTKKKKINNKNGIERQINHDETSPRALRAVFEIK